MIKKMLLVLAILLAASFSFAQESSAPGDQQTSDPSMHPATAAQAATRIFGVVDKIDLQKKVIHIKDEKTKMTTEYTFSDMTVFNNNQNVTVKAEDLKKGQKIAFEIDDNRVITNATLDPKESTTAPETQKPEN